MAPAFQRDPLCSWSSGFPPGVCVVAYLFAPPGLVLIPPSTYGLRRGLYSDAVARLLQHLPVPKLFRVEAKQETRQAASLRLGFLRD